MQSRSGSTSQVSAAHMGLRANRVVLLVPGTVDWKFVSRQAIRTFTTCWGGAGFVVVPVPPAGIGPAMLAALREYDPDVVAVPSGDSPIQVDDRQTLLDAQATISAACSNFRSPLAKGDGVAKPTAALLAENYLSSTGLVPTTPLNVLLEPGDDVPIGANPKIGGSLGLAASARWGLSESPTEEGDSAVDKNQEARAIWRLVSRDRGNDGLAPITTRNDYIGDYATEFNRTLFGLTSVVETGRSEPAPIAIVWGDEPSDFALAMTWDRTYDGGIWVPDEWWSENDLRNQIVLGIEILATSYQQSNRPIIFTSTSVSTDEMRTRLEICRQGQFGFARNLNVDEVVIAAQDLVFPRFFKSHFAIDRKFSEEWSTIIEHGDDQIDVAMMPPLPTIDLPGLETIEAKAHWQVDVQIRKHNLPCMVAIPEADLVAAGESTFSTRIRTSRSGVSYASHNTGFVWAGAAPGQRFVRPLVSIPSLAKWADARAQMQGMRTRISPAGLQARVLGSLLGERSDLAELISGPLLPAFQAFNRTGMSRDAFPSGDGCVVNGEAFMTFAGICTEVGMAGDARMRDTVDELLRKGFLYRGLLLRCEVCDYLAFTPVQTVGPTNQCQRCLGDTPLGRTSWRDPVSEPSWFYDLHRTARVLLKANGHVPLLLSRYLRREAIGDYVDAPEFEILDSDGKPLAETDLLALADRRVIIAEAKSTNSLGRGQILQATVRKRIQLAEVLAADEIILGTTDDAWDQNSVDAMKAAIDSTLWVFGQRPRLRTVTGLGQPQVVDRLI